MTDSTERLQSALAGRYQIERQIGHGGMATVYLARDTRHDRRVALKVLRPELAAVIGAERFALEIRTTANLQHPHILPLHDSGEVDGTVFYVMPFVEGETLRDRLVREGQLPVDDAITLIKQVASALDYAHRQGVVHRDIKPENILLHDGQALVADFGIALAASKSDNASRLTETGMSLGTPSYMSPEQAMGHREISARADVYALGCVLYEMLIGEPPFAGPNAQAIVAKILTEPAPSIVKQRPRVPAGIDVAVRRALEKLPADRFGSAKEFADALDDKELTVSAPVAHTAGASSRARQLAYGLAFAVVAVASLWIARRTAAEHGTVQRWQGELLGGPLTANEPRLSPDGQTLAFAAMVNGQTQIGVLRPRTRDWTILTSDRTRGVVAWLAWARDGSRIFYSRFFAKPLGIWSISPLGGNEKLVLENAASPEPLPDGSLLIARVTGSAFRLFHFWPETGRLDSLDAITRFITATTPNMRALPDGKRAVYLGRPASDTTKPIGFYVIDLVSGKSRLLWPRSGNVRVRAVPFAVSPDGSHLTFTVHAHDAEELQRVAIDGGSNPTTIATLQEIDNTAIDEAADGSIYFSDYRAPRELFWTRPGSPFVPPERIGDSPFQTRVLPLRDGRILIDNPGQMMVRPPNGGSLQPFVQTQIPMHAPMATLGPDRVVMIYREQADSGIAVVDAATGRVVSRIRAAWPSDWSSLVGSLDGTTLYYATNGTIYSLASSATDGRGAKRLSSGTGLAIDPAGRYLVITRLDSTGVRLVRHDLTSADETEIRITDGTRLTVGWLAPNAVAADGRIAVSVFGPESWFLHAGILDPRTGKVEINKASLGFDSAPGWMADGTLLTQGAGYEARLWRFTPVKP